MKFEVIENILNIIWGCPEITTFGNIFDLRNQTPSMMFLQILNNFWKPSKSDSIPVKNSWRMEQLTLTSPTRTQPQCKILCVWVNPAEIRICHNMAGPVCWSALVLTILLFMFGLDCTHRSSDKGKIIEFYCTLYNYIDTPYVVQSHEHGRPEWPKKGCSSEADVHSKQIVSLRLTQTLMWGVGSIAACRDTLETLWDEAIEEDSEHIHNKDSFTVFKSGEIWEWDGEDRKRICAIQHSSHRLGNWKNKSQSQISLTYTSNMLLQ